MAKVYIDNDYKCHVTNDGTMREVEDDFFDGKCPEFIEGYRYVPDGETWTRADSEEFTGVMVAPWMPYEELHKAQLEYELAQAKTELADADAALAILGVNEDA